MPYLLVAVAALTGYFPFKWLSGKDSAILPAYVLFLTLVAVIVYTFETRRLRQLSELQARPYVFISLQPVDSVPSLLNLVVQNIGPSPAYDIRFVVKQNVGLPTKKSISEVPFIENGLNCLAPNHRTQFLFYNLVGTQLENIPTTEIKVVYGRHKADAEPISETFSLDPAEFWGRPRVHEERYSKIEESLGKIHDDLSRILRKLPDPFFEMLKRKNETKPPNPDGE